MKKIMLVCFVFVAMTAVPGFCKEFNHSVAGISIWLPDPWEVQADNENLIYAEEPSGEAGLIYIIFDKKDLDAKLESLDKELSNLVDNLEIQNETASLDTINGMQALGISATGTSDGIAYNIGVIIMVTPKDKVLMVIAMISARHYDAHEKTLDLIVENIKPIQ